MHVSLPWVAARAGHECDPDPRVGQGHSTWQGHLAWSWEGQDPWDGAGFGLQSSRCRDALPKGGTVAGPVLPSQPAAAPVTPVGPALPSPALLGSSLSGALGSPVGAGNDVGNVRALFKLSWSWKLSASMASSLNSAPRLLVGVRNFIGNVRALSRLSALAQELEAEPSHGLLPERCPWITSWHWECCWEWPGSLQLPLELEAKCSRSVGLALINCCSPRSAPAAPVPAPIPAPGTRDPPVTPRVPH